VYCVLQFVNREGVEVRSTDEISWIHVTYRILWKDRVEEIIHGKKYTYKIAARDDPARKVAGILIPPKYPNASP